MFRQEPNSSGQKTKIAVHTKGAEAILSRQQMHAFIYIYHFSVKPFCAFFGCFVDSRPGGLAVIDGNITSAFYHTKCCKKQNLQPLFVHQI